MMRINKLSFLIFIGLIFNTIGSNSLSCENCKTEFTILGINDFKIFSSKKNILDKYPEIKKVLKKILMIVKKNILNLRKLSQ